MDVDSRDDNQAAVVGQRSWMSAPIAFHAAAKRSQDGLVLLRIEERDWFRRDPADLVWLSAWPYLDDVVVFAQSPIFLQFQPAPKFVRVFTLEY